MEKRRSKIAGDQRLSRELAAGHAVPVDQLLLPLHSGHARPERVDRGRNGVGVEHVVGIEEHDRIATAAREAGVADYTAITWNGILAPANTPRAEPTMT